jgi:hypothetical protein
VKTPLANVTLVTLALAAPTLSCKDKKAVNAQVSEAALRADLPRAIEAANRLTGGMVERVGSVASQIARPLAAGDQGNLRAELVALSTPGGPLTMYSFSFVVAIDRDGRVVARDKPNESDDRMKGMQFRPLFSCVGRALENHAELCVGELPAEGETPSRAVLLAATPLLDAQNQVIGALGAGVTFGPLSRMIDSATRLTTGDAVFWTALRYNGRVFPSGTDRDVTARWLLPAVLVRRAPRTPVTAPTFVNYIEDGRGWAAAFAPLASIPSTEVLLYRSEARQN